MFTQRRYSPGVFSTTSMLTASLGFGLMAAANGDLARLPLTHVSMGAWLALAYLTVFGSCIAFSAFAWLTQHAKPQLVSTYSYVNPVIAVLLGAVFLHERIDHRILAGAALILCSVAVVVRANRNPRSDSRGAASSMPHLKPKRI